MFLNEKPFPPRGVRTIAVHAGEFPDPVTRATTPNIVMSTSFTVDPGSSFSAEDFNENIPYAYSRWKNPTVYQLEQKLAALERAEAAVAFGSGMAAITGLFLHVLSAGDHLVMTDVAYAAAAELTNELLPKLGITVTKVDMSDPENIRAAIRPETRLIYAETPVNPILRLTDIEAVAAIAREKEVKFAVDSTFASPLGIRPIDLGADFVVHSLTKYLCGHGDAIGGAVLGKQEEIAAIRKWIAIKTGGILSPFNAWLILRGAATLPLRMKAHEEGALAIARFLEGHPKIVQVVYPGLPSHPQHELARRQMQNFSGMLTFRVEGGKEAAKLLAGRLSLIHYAVSLGHHRSLIFYLPTQEMIRTSFKLTREQEKSYRAYAGDGIFRLSVGLEEPADLIADLEYALAGL